MTLPTLFHRRHTLPVRRSDPFVALHDEVNRLFEGFWPDLEAAPAGATGFRPRLDVEETDAELVVTAELPGLEEKDFGLELHGDVLTLKGEKRSEREDRKRGWYERTHGSFTREIPLPCEVDADKVEARFDKGVLTIRLPKPPEASARSRRIEVTSG